MYWETKSHNSRILSLRKTIQTNETGNYSTDVDAGNYTVSYDKDGYISVTEGVNVTAEDTKYIQKSLVEKANLSITSANIQDDNKGVVGGIVSSIGSLL